MNKNKRSNKEIIAEKQAEKEKLEKDIAKLKKQENSKRINKQLQKGEIGDNSFVMIYSTLYSSNAYRELKPISKEIYIGMGYYMQKVILLQNTLIEFIKIYAQKLLFKLPLKCQLGMALLKQYQVANLIIDQINIDFVITGTNGIKTITNNLYIFRCALQYV